MRGPDSVRVFPESTLIPPPAPLNVIPRADVNEAVASSVPPAKVTPPDVAPRTLSLATARMPLFKKVPPA